MTKPLSLGNKLSSILIVVFGVYSYLFFSILFNSLIGNIAFIEENKNVYLILSLLGSVGLYKLLIFFFRRFTKTIEKRKLVTIPAFFYLELIFLGCLLQFVVFIFFYLTYGCFPPSEAELEFAEMLTTHYWYVGLLSLVIAPIFEELVFRKYVLLILTKSFSPASSIILSAFFFGAYHLTLRQFLFSTLLGLLFGMLYYKSGRLSLTIVMHFSFNAFAFVVESLVGGLLNTFGTTMFLLSFPLFVLLGLFGVIIVLKQLKMMAAVSDSQSVDVESEEKV